MGKIMNEIKAGTDFIRDIIREDLGKNGQLAKKSIQDFRLNQTVICT